MRQAYQNSCIITVAFIIIANLGRKIPVDARSKAWVCSRSLAGTVGSNPGGSMDVCFECCELKGRGLWDGLIPRPEESYRARACVRACVCVYVIR